METKFIKLPQIKDLNAREISLSYPHIKYGGKGPRIIAITDTITKDEKDTGELFSGAMGSIVRNVYDLAVDYGKAAPSEIVFLSSSVTFGKVSDREKGEDTHKTIERIVRVINKFKPDVLLFMGYRHLNEWRDVLSFNTIDGVTLSDKDLKNVRGRHLKVKVGHTKCNAVFTFSPFNFASLDPRAFGTDVNLMGFVVRDIEQAIHGKNFYTVPPADKKKWHIIDSVKKFDRMMEIVSAAEIVSIDTEGKNLNRVYGNQLYTVHITVDGETAFTLPYMHPKTPFLPKELEYIREALKQYFERGKSKYHIYQNAKFDLLVFFSVLRIEFYNHRLYDISVGEMNLDENRKFFRNVKHGAYDLESLSAKYGSLSYADSPIGKEDRGNMGKFSIEEINLYGSIDVLNPFNISKFQIEEAKRRGPAYDNFLNAVIEIGSDKLLSFVEMERNGLPVDKDYLVSQLAPTSELNKLLSEKEQSFKEFDSVKKLNALLCARAGIPTSGRGLIGNHSETNYWLFKSNKDKHLQELFFNVLNLEPISLKKDGSGAKTDKLFIAEYGEKVPEVKTFSEIRRLKALINSFIKGILKDIINNEDNKDSRVRSTYDFIRIITGRSGSKAP